MPVPTNDDFANATVITGASGTSGPVTIDDATVEGGEDVASGFGTNHETVWWSWTAPESRSYRFSTHGSVAGDFGSGDGDPNFGSFGGLDTRMAVWSGTTLGSLTDKGHNDDNGDGFEWSLVIFTATAGTTYHIQVGTFGAGYTGTVLLSWAPQVAAPALQGFHSDFSNVKQSGGHPASYLTQQPVKLPDIIEEGDCIIVYAGCQGFQTSNGPEWWTSPVGDDGNPRTTDAGPSVFDDVTLPQTIGVDMSIDAGWTELTSWSLTYTDVTFPNGGFFKIWYKTATTWNEPDPTITKTQARESFSTAMVVGNTVNAIDVFGPTLVDRRGTQTGTIPTVTSIREGYYPQVLGLVGHVDIFTLSAAPSSEWSGTIYSGNTQIGTGVGGAFVFRTGDATTISSGEFFWSSNYTMTDDSSIKGTTYAPHSAISLAIYQSSDETTWHKGTQYAADANDTCQPVQVGQYIYQLSRDAISKNGLFYRYDIDADSWTTLTPIPGRYKQFGGGAAYDGKIYYFGGNEAVNGSTSTADVMTTRIYNIGTDSWSTGTDMPSMVIGTLVNSISNSDLVFDVDEGPDLLAIDSTGSQMDFRIGSEPLINRITNRVHVSGTTYTWTVSARTSGAAHSAGATLYGGDTDQSTYPYAITVGDRIYVAGGFGMGRNETNDDFFRRYNPVADTWTQLGAMPVGQEFGGGSYVSSTNELHYIGANVVPTSDAGTPDPTFNTGTQFLSHQVYSLDSATWTIYPNVTTPDTRDRQVDVESGAQLYDPVTNDIVVHTYESNAGNFAGSSYLGGGRAVFRWNIDSQLWTPDHDIDLLNYTGHIFDTQGAFVHGARRLFVYDNENVDNFPGIIYYDITVTQAWDVLSTVATIDHDVLTGIEADQHHTQRHFLDERSHDAGLYYKSGVSPTISDTDFISPANGMVAVTYDTYTGMRLIWVRSHGIWLAVET